MRAQTVEDTTSKQTRGKRPDMDLARVGLKLVADGFVNPVALACPPDGTGRLFVVDQVGKVYVLSGVGKKREHPFLDISEKVVELSPGYDERGLLGMAFHPRFGQNRKFYLFYSAPLRKGGPEGWNCTNHLSEFTQSEEDPGRADPSSERILLSIDKPQMNHNGGHITFGPDGYLYVPLGDGGGFNDNDFGHNPDVGNGQDLNTLFGKILRIDVDDRADGKEYGIPEDNPFVNGEGRPEIFSYGMRNPYHIAFDAGGERQLFAGDSGQNRWEEADIIVAGGNYGWNIKEGSHYFNHTDSGMDYLSSATTGYRGEKLIDPFVDYPNVTNLTGGVGTVVIGGYVYRGKDIPFLEGRYVFGDLSGTAGQADGRLWVASPPSDGNGRWTMDEITVKGRGRLNEYLLAFGQDADNELYILSSDTQGPKGRSGRLYRIIHPDEGEK